MAKQLKILFSSICFISQLTAASSLATSTYYETGVEIAGSRYDRALLGDGGGFDGFKDPGPKCSQLFISFFTSSAPPAANTVLTNSYTGSGSAPLLPETVTHLYITGDLSYFDTAVSSGPQFALPTPNKNTIIHFSLNPSYGLRSS